MGLIKAFMGSAGGTLADQWKEMFYCDALPADVLVKKGQKKVSKRSSNTKASENIISSGSVVVVNDGQCMIIVDQGKIVEICAEPGEFIYDASTEPSIFSGGLGKGIIESFKTFGKRFTFGGDTGHDQRIYYINTKEIYGNKYGTANPIPFRVIDKNINLDIEIALKCFGEYSYKIIDPILFYTNVSGNVEEDYNRDIIEPQLRSELLTALQPAFAEISAKGVRYSEVPAHADDLADLLNNILSDKWAKLRGIEIVTFGVSSITASQEDADLIKQHQSAAVNRDPGMAAATTVAATAEAMKMAASNENAGAFMGFAGMNMAQGTGNGAVDSLFRMAESNKQNAGGNNQTNQNSGFNNQSANQNATANNQAEWVCQCGFVNTGNFCSNCGGKKPAPAVWTCQCGTSNTGNFCSNCGSPRA